MTPRTISQDDFENREKELINISRDLVEQDCLSTLTIDKMVAAAPYSKGTIYKHFIGKEDLLLAICNTSMQELQALFARALTFNGNSRERIIAVMIAYVIWAKLHPAQLFVVLSAHAPNVMACASEQRLTEHHDCEQDMMDLMNIEISNAIEANDLVLSEDMCQEQVTFAMWSALWGAMALVTSKGESKKLSHMVLERESYTNARLILDGFNWKPHSSHWDYNNSIKRIIKELFKPEADVLAENDTPLQFDN